MTPPCTDCHDSHELAKNEQNYIYEIPNMYVWRATAGSLMTEKVL